MTDTTPKPECRLGYTEVQLDAILGDRRANFNRWMRGQTIALCGGPRDGGDRTCTVPHGVAVYPWDLENFLRGGPILD